MKSQVIEKQRKEYAEDRVKQKEYIKKREMRKREAKAEKAGNKRK